MLRYTITAQPSQSARQLSLYAVVVIDQALSCKGCWRRSDNETGKHTHIDRDELLRSAYIYKM
jgi:hypothetical protein